MNPLEHSWYIITTMHEEHDELDSTSNSLKIWADVFGKLNVSYDSEIFLGMLNSSSHSVKVSSLNPC
jgi:hypothetical protein